MRSIERIFFGRVLQPQLRPRVAAPAQTARCSLSSGNLLCFFCSDSAIGLQFENVRVLFVKIKKMSDNVFRFVCNKKGFGIDVVD
jgi:hypothetical protein